MTHRTRNAWSRNPITLGAFSLAAGALGVAASMTFGSASLAQPSTGMTITHPVTSGGSGTAPTEPLVVHDPYSESAHFVVRHLNLESQGPTIHVQPGTTVHAELDINEHCSACPSPHTHILVGFQGQANAAACAWSGLRESGGWRHERFSMIVPMQPGVYPIRVRQASNGSQTCDDATLSYWTRDLPGGPGPESTIGVLVVESMRPTVVPSTGTGTGTTGTTSTTGSTGTTSSVTTTTSSAGLVTTTTTTTQALAPASIANGSFEQPDVAAGQTVPMSSILGWVRTSGSGVEVHDRAVGSASAGEQWVELDGVDSSSIAADVGTTANGTYLVTLAFAARPGTSALDNRLEVRWGGEVIATLSASGEGASTASWTHVSFRVRATSAMSRLELRDVGASNGQGTYVDDVSITAAR